MRQTKSTVKWEIVRETSKYNKRIKWYYRTYLDDGTMVSSTGCRTKDEAQSTHDHMVYIGKEGFHIGNHVKYVDYIPKQ